METILNIIWTIERVVSNFFYSIKMKYQSICFGINEDEIYNFDETVAKQISACTMILSESLNGSPKGLSEREWSNILKQISFGFRSYLEMRSGMYTLKDKEFKNLLKDYNKGMELFVKYHQDLWD